MDSPTFTRRTSLASFSALFSGSIQGDADWFNTEARRSKVVQVIDNVAVLKNWLPRVDENGLSVFVQGYHSSANPDGGGIFIWAAQSVVLDNGGTVINPHKADDKGIGRWLRVFDGPINIKWFGAIGDGQIDDTRAIQNAIDSTIGGGALIFPNGQYLVTMLDTRRGETSWYFDHAELIGGAKSATPCLIHMRGLQSRFFEIKINLNFNNNYACALWWYNEDDASQYNQLYGLEIRYAKRGIVYGALIGQTSSKFAQSENVIYGYISRGVEKPLLMNHLNGVLFLSMPQLVAHNEEWDRDRPGQFDVRGNRAFEALAGTLVINGGEIQNSIAAVTSVCAIVNGGDVFVNNCIVEVSAPFRVRGTLNITGGRILNTQSMTSQFLVDEGASARTTLRVSDCRMLRNVQTGSFSDRSLIIGPEDSDKADITLDNCQIEEWAKFAPLAAGNNNLVHFQRCQWRPQGESGGSYFLDTRGSNLLEGHGIDRGCRTLAGFWFIGDKAGVANLTSDSPRPSYAKSLSVAAKGAAGLFTINMASLETIRDTGISVCGGDKFLVEAWVRSAAGRNVGLAVVLLDGNGHQIRHGGGDFLTVCDTYQNFVSEHWKYLRQVVEIPAGAAAFAGFGGYGVDGEIRFCGLEVRRA